MSAACQQCGSAFEPKRAHARFCSDACRAVAWKGVGDPPAREVRPIDETSPTTLYRLFDGDGVLLYVGITSRHPVRRLEGHAEEKVWWEEAATATFEHFPTRRAARIAEADAIREESPRENIRMEVVV